jgi:hypothetical protein
VARFLSHAAQRNMWMAKPELGTKRVCVACGTRFYDLTKIRAAVPSAAPSSRSSSRTRAAPAAT